MRPTNENERQQSAEAVAHAAQGLIDGTAAYLPTVRLLSSLRFQASDDEHDPDFLIFVAIDSETDHLPAPHARPLCAQAWLEACDAQERAAEAFYRDAVRQACHKLIQRYGRLQGQRQGQD